MEIIVGKTAGFCGGVTNAVKQTENLLQEGREIFCLGELVHNAQVMEKLEKQGHEILLPNSTIKGELDLVFSADETERDKMLTSKEEVDAWLEKLK